MDCTWQLPEYFPSRYLFLPKFRKHHFHSFRLGQGVKEQLINLLRQREYLEIKIRKLRSQTEAE